MNEQPGIQHKVMEPEQVAHVVETLPQDTSAIERARAKSGQPARPPAEVPGYEISRCLGEGAFGSVWLGREQSTGKQVAIKFYTHRRGLDWSLLNREVEKLAVLYTSRQIVGLLDVGWDADPPYYVMEYLENGSLARLLADGPLPPHEAVRIVCSVLRGLVHAHGRGILHCDLKPANVLLDADFEPRLCDFGQSRLSNEQQPALGTMFYMAPEQADLNAVPDARWDVYALGALLYHLLCGAAPYRTAEHERAIQSAGPLSERLAVYRRILTDSPRPRGHRRLKQVDRRLAEIVERCLQLDPNRRFPNAQAVLDMLELRERHRARRPLVVLGVVGPVLLLGAMFVLALVAMKSARQTARRHLADRALQGDVDTARILARIVERELEDRQFELDRVAADSALRKAIEDVGQQWPEELRQNVVQRLAELKATVDAERTRREPTSDASWFLVDARGLQRWREPPDLGTLDKRWSHRDYFHGLGREFPVDAVPQDVTPIRQPHVSLAFRSRATNKYMVAVSVPVWDASEQRVIGVLARTMHLGEILADFEQQLQHRDANRADRVMALIDQRDGKLLDHPWLRGTDLRNVPDRTIESLTLTAAQATRLSNWPDDLSQAQGIDRNSRYEDPVGRIASDYTGEWLAAFWPVSVNRWLAVVQERKQDALQPVEEMQSLTWYVCWALLVSGVLIGTLWFVVLRALNDRRWRSIRRTAVGAAASATTVATD